MALYGSVCLCMAPLNGTLSSPDMKNKNKTCRKCKETKPVEKFYKCSNNKDGLQYRCKACNKIARANWYKKNCEYEKQKAKVYAQSNPAIRKKNWQKYYAKNKEKRKQYNKDWRNANPGYEVNIENKTCSTCKENKPAELFCKRTSSKDGLRSQCKTCEWAYTEKNREKIRVKSRERYSNNRELLNEQTKEYQRNNKAKVRKYQASWVDANREHVNKKRRERARKRRKKDVVWAISKDLSSSLAHIMKDSQKHTAHIKMLKCSRIKLMGYMQRNFSEFMTFQNRGRWKSDLPPHPTDGTYQSGKWHVDHIVPKYAFDLSRPIEQHICEWYKNLKPMWATSNMQKSKKYDPKDKQNLIKEWIFYNI